VVGELAGEEDRDGGFSAAAIGVGDGEDAGHAEHPRCGAPEF
jgi:hypothetical protein